MQLLVESLRLSTPIALGAMAGLWCERSGVVNIGIEGMMLTSACTGSSPTPSSATARTRCGAVARRSAWPSSPAGSIALLHALLSVTFRVDQIISGVVINLLALGLTGFLRSEVLVDTGISTGVPTPTIGLPLLSEIPIVGPQLFTNKPIFFAMFVDRRPHRLGPVPHRVRPAGPVGRRAPARRGDARHRPDPHPLPRRA